MLLGQRATAVDPVGHAVTRGERSTVKHGRPIWVTGRSPRWLTRNGHDLVGVQSVRTSAHDDWMIGELGDTRDLLAIGTGNIELTWSSCISLQS